MESRDPIVEETWKSREQLLEQHGGLEGYFEISESNNRNIRTLAEPNNVKRAG